MYLSAQGQLKVADGDNNDGDDETPSDASVSWSLLGTNSLTFTLGCKLLTLLLKSQLLISEQTQGAQTVRESLR